jgi:hypothetical protein
MLTLYWHFTDVTFSKSEGERKIKMFICEALAEDLLATIKLKLVLV